MNNFKLEQDRFLFTDIFIARDSIIFISMMYPDIKINFDKVKCHCLENIFIFNKMEIYERRQSSVIAILTNDLIKDYLADNKILDITIEYNGIKKTYKLSKSIVDKKYNLSMFTLFKDDPYLIDCWIDYYKQLGVEHFYLYYNGLLKDIDNIINRFDKNEVTFVEWDYKYWIDDYDKKKAINKTVSNNINHAQPMAINSCMYKFGEFTNWLALFDLDEYVKCDNLVKLLDQYNLDQTYCVYFQNSWADAENINKYNLTLDELKMNKIVRDKKILQFPYKSKNIINPINVLNCKIHDVPRAVAGKNQFNSNKYFLHFYKFSSKNRIDNEIIVPINDKL